MLSPITQPVPIYEGLLCLATDEELRLILAGGPRELLDNNRVFGSQVDYQNANAAYVAIETIVARLHADSFCITGIDSRHQPPKRDRIEVEVVLRGRLLWEGPHGVKSTLLLEWTTPLIAIVDLYIEPAEPDAPTASTSVSTSPRLATGERKDDTKRLRIMQEHMNDGEIKLRAAMKAAGRLPDPPTSLESLAKRLVRKYNRLHK